MDDVTMRQARPADAERIAAYHHACWLLAFTPILSAEVIETAAPQLALWNDWLDTSSEFTTIVAVDDVDQPFGHTTVKAHQLVHLFVSPEQQGRGIGSQLLAIGEQHIRDAGHGQAELHTRVGNARALRLYRSAGWILTDELIDDELPDGSFYPEHVLRKDLEASRLAP